MLSDLGAHVIELSSGLVHMLSRHLFECPHSPIVLDGYFSPLEKGRSVFAAVDVAVGLHLSSGTMYFLILIITLINHC